VTESTLSRAAGWAAIVSGVCFAVSAVRAALLPTGCVGDECLSHPMRPQSALVNVLYAVGALALLVAVAGLMWILKRRGLLGRTGSAGLASCGLAVVVLAAGAGLQAVAHDAMEDLMPAFVLPGVALLVVGVALVAVTVLRSGLLPRSAGALLLVSACILAFVNEEDARILLLVPFALAWVVTGVLLLRTAPLSRRLDARSGSRASSSLS
jgi:hypothetical protein